VGNSTAPMPAQSIAHAATHSAAVPVVSPVAPIPQGVPIAMPNVGSVTPAPAAKRCPVCDDRFPIDFRVCPRDAVELEMLDEEEFDPYLGQTLGDVYRVTRVVGQGGMGRVYEARHVRLSGRRFAVKIMHRAHVRNPELVRRFRREAETAHLAAHPNVVQVFDVSDTPDGVPFIVTELLEGEDLADRLDRVGKLELDVTVHIAKGLCAALTQAHAQGVIHRDLKPDNVYLVGGPSIPLVKLIDFGIARVQEAADATRTRTGVIMGTPAFMAPEQARGAKVDHRADIYSVGAILYRCLTGRLPYDLDDPAATLTALLTREPDPPRALAPEISQAVELVIERAMARDPNERFQSLAELDAALGSLVVAPLEVSLAGRLPQSVEDSVVRATGSNPGAVAPAIGVTHRARPKLIALTFVAWVVIVGAIVDLLGQLLGRMWGEAMGKSEGLLVLLGTIAALATPTYLWIRFLGARIWGNSTRCIQVSDKLGLALGSAAVAWVIVIVTMREIEMLMRGGTKVFRLSQEPWLTSVAVGAAFFVGLVSVVFSKKTRPTDATLTPWVER
jgi:serine/threonine-protein kinase